MRKKVITHTNSYVIRKKPKSFFKRLGEVFAPGKADSTQVSNVIQEEYTDTLTEAYSPADTVVTMLKDIQSRVTDTHHSEPPRRFASQKTPPCSTNMMAEGRKPGVRLIWNPP